MPKINARAGDNAWRNLFYEQVGKRMRDKRVSLGLTLSQMSTKMGVGLSTLNRTEQGDLPPSLHLLARFAAVAGCQVGDLVPDVSKLDVTPKVVSGTRQGFWGTLGLPDA